MHRFFIEKASIGNGESEEKLHVWIDGEDGKHILRVLRLQRGDVLQVVVNEQEEWIGEIVEEEKKRVKVRLTERIREERESPIHITLYQGVAKATKMETVIQKSVELGVKTIVPVLMKRSVVEFKNQKDREKKRERWQRIAYEAAKQCKRLEVPEVREPISFEDCIDSKEQDEVVYSIVAYEEEKNVSLKDALRMQRSSYERYALWVGPEGGFEEEEVRQLTDRGVVSVSLGKRILRTETAAITLIAVLQYERGDLGGKID